LLILRELLSSTHALLSALALCARAPGCAAYALVLRDALVAVLTPIANLENFPLEKTPESLTLIKKYGQQKPSNCAASLADHVRNLGREPEIAAFLDRPVAVLVAIADIETVSLSNNSRFLEIIQESRQQQKASKVVSSEDVRKQLGLE